MEWQPIETAPNLEPVLLFTADVSDEYHIGIAIPNKHSTIWITVDGRTIYDPTNWMPLEPPKGAD